MKILVIHQYFSAPVTCGITYEGQIYLYAYVTLIIDTCKGNARHYDYAKKNYEELQTLKSISNVEKRRIRRLKHSVITYCLMYSMTSPYFTSSRVVHPRHYSDRK